METHEYERLATMAARAGKDKTKVSLGSIPSSAMKPLEPYSPSLSLFLLRNLKFKLEGFGVI